MKTIKISERSLNTLIDKLLQDYGTFHRLKVSDVDSYEYHTQKAHEIEEEIKSIIVSLLKES